MNPLRRTRLFIAAICLLVLPACWASIPFALDETPQLPIKTELLGSWVCIGLDYQAKDIPEDGVLRSDGNDDFTPVIFRFKKASDREYVLEETLDKKFVKHRTYASMFRGEWILNARAPENDDPGWALGRPKLLAPNV